MRDAEAKRRRGDGEAGRGHNDSDGNPIGKMLDITENLCKASLKQAHESRLLTSAVFDVIAVPAESPWAQAIKAVGTNAAGASRVKT